MTIPAYLEIFRQAVREQEEKVARERWGHALNALNAKSPHLSTFNTFNALPPCSFGAALEALERRCPDHIEPDRWRQCIDDAQRFIAEWDDQAEALGWTSTELFGLHTPPANPHPSYNRLSRYDATGLIWHLTGNRVVAVTADTAAIESLTNVLIYRKRNKPGLGPVGDSLDDFK